MHAPLAMPDFRPDAFPGEPQLVPVKIRDLPGAVPLQLMLLGFSSMEMESPVRGQDMDRLDLVSLYRVDWVVTSEYPNSADTFSYLICLCRICFQLCNLESLLVLNSCGGWQVWKQEI